jgi:protein involved in polysaccharide export with SLBB domain
VDIIGQIQAAGKTPTQLQNEIGRQMSRLTRDVSQSVVRVTAYNYNHVFVIGQVLTPGKKSFEEIPDLWTLLNEAGGFTDLADLSRVTIIRGGEESGKVEVVDVAGAIKTGRIDQLPKIRRQDTIEIPRTAADVPSAQLARTTERKNLIYVMGAVNTPGPKTFEEGIDLLDALALADGPTETADLKKTVLVVKDGYYSQAVTFDLNVSSNSGLPARYIMQREDAIIVPARQPSFAESGLRTTALVVGVIASLVVTYEIIRRNTE